MSVVTEPSRPALKASPCDHPFRITIELYHQMADSGVLRENAPIYLWKGRLIEKMTKKRPHTYALAALNSGFVRLVPEGWFVQPEQPMTIDDDGEPEPDLTVVRGALTDYKKRHPSAKDVALVIEIAESSLAEDQGDVLETYAAQGIPVYWIVNLPKRWIEVYTEPTGPVAIPLYRVLHKYGPDDEVPVVLDGREVGRVVVRDILP